MQQVPRILIIGKNSFIGKNFREYSRHSLVDEVDAKAIKPEELDFEGYDVVLHLAALVHQSTSIGWEEYARVNTKLPIDMAIKAKMAGVEQFIFMSTSKVYGKYNPAIGSWTENSPCNPTNFYGISKRQAEVELAKLNDRNFNVSIIRTPMVYGKGVKANMLSLIKLVDRIPVLPFKGIHNRRSLTFVGNLAAFIDRIIELNAKGVFIAMDSYSPSMEELVHSIAVSLGKRPKLFYPGNLALNLSKKIFSGYYDRLYSDEVLDNSNTLNLLSFTPPFNLDKGIKETVDFYLKSIGRRSYD
jgi:UDP-glucose 4-epimerase